MGMNLTGQIGARLRVLRRNGKGSSLQWPLWQTKRAGPNGRWAKAAVTTRYYAVVAKRAITLAQRTEQFAEMIKWALTT